MYENYLFYDVEVFEHNSMVVFKNIEGETVKVFSSSLDGLGELLNKGLITKPGYDNLENYIRGKILVGYNNFWYDDYILYAMTVKRLNPFIKEWNDIIINNGHKSLLKKIDVCTTFDTFQQIDVSRPSLKKVEGNMGLSIVESSVDFNIDRELSPSENLETFKYCEYDVLQTVNIFKMRKQYFESKFAVIQMLPEKMREMSYKWNTTSIVGQLLTPKNKAPHRCLVPDSFFEYVPTEVVEMWDEIRKPNVDFKFKKKKVIVDKHGIVFEFGWGGLHGAPKEIVNVENVRLRDVTSMYPNIIINLNGLGDKTVDYQEILNLSTRLKNEGKKAEREPYKLILNSTYGLLNNQYSSLNNPYLAYSVCIYGQIALYTLCERLVQVGAKLINVNTDGVAYTINSNEDETVIDQWEKDFNLNLEIDFYDKWIQKDVNNYIAVTENGYMHLKGGDVNKYYKNKFFSNNDIRIVQKALVDYLVYEKSINETIIENLDKPLLFQYILKAGGTYQGVVYKHKPDELLQTTTNRVFATKEQGVEILKKRQDGGLVKFADTPDNMMIWNDDVNEFKNFKDIVDKQYYADLTKKKLLGWGVKL